MTRTVRYVTADVFTGTPFSGNQLAVVFGAEGLPTETLQAITREFNYSESTFVFAPEDPAHTRRVRIFTPEEELPFAGHPTVGTAHVLVATGEVPAADPGVTVVLGEGVGPVPVHVRTEQGVPVHAQLTAAAAPEERTVTLSIEEMAAVLSLSPDDLLGGDYAPTAVSCGLPWLMVPLRSVEAVARARVKYDLWQQRLHGTWAAWPFVFAMTDGAIDPAIPAGVQGTDIRARAFLPGAAVPEDPATGSANASLAAFLAARTPRVPADGVLRWSVAQGVEMGRASRLSIEATRTGTSIESVRVGGSTVIVAEGTMRVGV